MVGSRSRRRRQALSTDQLTPEQLNEANISLVLSCVFKHLPHECLLKARHVCKGWNKVISTASPLSVISEIMIRGDPDDTLGALASAEYKSWSNFRFITPKLDNTSRIQIFFWQVFGPTVKSLNFVAHALGPVTFLEILFACPSLEELTFSCKKVYDYHPPKSEYEPIIIPVHCQKLIPQLGSMRTIGVLEKLSRLTILDSNYAPPGILKDFLEWCHNLTQLTLFDDNKKVVPHWDARNILHFAENRAEYLRRLEITGSHFFPEHIFALSKLKNLKLQSIHLRYTQVTDSCLISLFRRQKYLEEIDISFTNFSEKAFLNSNCTFLKLRKLNLSGFSSSVTSVGFLSRMPNLVDLNLSSSYSQTLNWEQLVSCLLPLRLKKLQSLNLSFNLGLGVFPRSSFFTSLMTCYSHITSINLSLNNFLKDSLLHEIWRYMRCLRVVFLEHLSGITNEGFNGIRQAQMQAPMSNGSMDKVNPQILRYQNSGGSYIGLCSSIEILSIAHNGRLSDFAVQFGLRDLHRLQKLNISGCNQITHQSLLELVTNCPRLEYLDLSGVPIPEYWVQWAKEKRPRLRRVIGKPEPQVTMLNPYIIPPDLNDNYICEEGSTYPGK